MTAAPPADPVRQAIRDSISAKKDHQPGDLITRGDFDLVIELLETTGAPVEGFAAIRDQIPADDTYLQRLNSSPRGRKFLRKVASIPGGYASVEELASRSGGEETLNRLSRDKGGEEMIAYLATTPGGRQMMRQTPAARRPKQPQAPRVYTAEQLLVVMHSPAKNP